MHRDHKLGLALGVLVVGFAAALCFPRQGDVDQRLLQLENTAELDAEIAQLPVHAYTNADEPAAAPADPQPDAVTEPKAAEIVPDGEGDLELLAGAPAPIGSPVTSSDPNPNVVELDFDQLAADLDHEFSPALQSDSGLGGDSSAEIATADERAQREYVVQPGDTLSNLAALYLGNHGRYLELFDANREVLATPDDLQPGMVLVIPKTRAQERSIQARRGSRGAAPLGFEAGNVVKQESTADGGREDQPTVEAPERHRLFRPASSAPFLKARPVSRGNALPLPPLDASARSREETDSSVEPAATQTYTVRRGDTLEGIAVQTYGDPLAVRDLLNANEDIVRDPRRLKPGMLLTLPERK